VRIDAICHKPTPTSITVARPTNLWAVELFCSLIFVFGVRDLIADSQAGLYGNGRDQRSTAIALGENMLRRTVSFALGCLVFLAGPMLSWAQNGTTVLTATLAQPNQKTAEISTEELRRILANKTATVFDARPQLEYAISHIPGAINVSQKPGVPLSSYVSDVAEIGRVLGSKKEAPIVLYCAGPFCEKSKRLAEELVGAGYTNVRRYQLGIPVWRALGGVTQIEPAGIRYVREGDKTAVFFDARSAEEFMQGTLEGARHLPKDQVIRHIEGERLCSREIDHQLKLCRRRGERARRA
jgi:rhodanese-related sulfurtransferase